MTNEKEGTNIIHDDPLHWKRSEETKDKLRDIIEKIIKENSLLSVTPSETKTTPAKK